MIIDEKLKDYATPRQAEMIDAWNREGTPAGAARALGIKSSANITDALRLLKAKAALAGYAPEFDMIHPVANGFGVKGTSTLYTTDKVTGEKVVSAQWVKTRRDDALAEQIVREFVATLTEDVRGLAPLTTPPSRVDEDLLAVYPMGDPHFGLYAWAEEAGEDFDLDMAERLTTGAIDRLVSSAPAAKTAIILNLGDYFHADDSKNQTPGHGHALDVDGRYTKVMRIGLRAMVHCVRRALEKHERVVVRNVRGNHDGHASFALALALDAFFCAEPRVEVDMHAAAIWAFQFGKVMISATHGDQCRMAALPGVMACDWPEMWGSTRFRYGMLGHVHHDEVKEYPGVKCESFRTLAARDAWHAGMGYRAGRDMRLIVMHKDFGEIERHRCDVAMLEAPAQPRGHGRLGLN